MSDSANSSDKRANSIGSGVDLDREIEKVKLQAEKFKKGEAFSDSEIANIRNPEQQQKFNRIEHHYNKKGILHFWYVKVPLKILNVGSIKDNNALLVDSYRALTSKACPLCSQGILMFNRNIEPQAEGVQWFCSRNPVCAYTVMGPPSGALEINPVINEIVDGQALQLGRGRWEKLSKNEKEELITSHLEKAKIYRAFALFSFLMFGIQLVLFFVKSSMFLYSSIFIFFVMAYLTILSLDWAYRAWQIKTGNVFLQENPFLGWLKNAEQYYSVDWAEPDSQTEKNLH